MQVLREQLSPIYDINVNPIDVHIYKLQTQKKIEDILGFSWPIDTKILDRYRYFLKNKDHGIEHAGYVYNAAIAIADMYQKEGTSVDKNSIYIMTLFHDMGRSTIYTPISDTPQQHASVQRRHKRNDSKHEYIGAKIFKNMLTNIDASVHGLKDTDIRMIEDYLVNHDFLNQQLNGKRFHEPLSLEGKICRLADRISVPLEDEIDRYRATGKKLGTPFFDANIRQEDRKNFSFDDIKVFLSKKAVDQCTFFISLLSISPEDFSDPILQNIYKTWAQRKIYAIDHIVKIAKIEGYTQDMIDEMIKVLRANSTF